MLLFAAFMGIDRVKFVLWLSYLRCAAGEQEHIGSGNNKGNMQIVDIY